MYQLTRKASERLNKNSLEKPLACHRSITFYNKRYLYAHTKLRNNESEGTFLTVHITILPGVLVTSTRGLALTQE